MMHLAIRVSLQRKPDGFLSLRFSCFAHDRHQRTTVKMVVQPTNIFRRTLKLEVSGRVMRTIGLHAQILKTSQGRRAA